MNQQRASSSRADSADYRFVSTLTIVVLATVIASSGPQPPSSQPDQPPFRSGVQLVEVDVRVFDKDGRFVTDLTREDFELIEDGAPQQILALYLVDGPGGARRVDASLSSRPPDRAVPAAPARQTWIFLFDLNHLAPGSGFDRARSAVEEFIRDRFQEGDVGGIVAGARMVNNRLTSIREELVAAVKTVKPAAEARSRQIELTREFPRLQDELEAIQISNNDSEALRRAVIRACSDDPDVCRRVDPELQIREKARRLHLALELATKETLTAMAGLASGLARMPGPKTIVFLSDGFVTERMETTLQQVVGRTGRAGARVYAIDVRGLNRGRGAGIIDQAAAEDSAGAFAQFDAAADGPNSLAIDTGGLMIRNENNIGRALDQIARDANSYYVLGYQPADAAFDGRFRPIDVRVKRPDVRVRARRGYVALEPARMLVPQPIASAPGIDETPETGTSPAEESIAAAASLALPAAGELHAPGSRSGRPEAVEHVESLMKEEAGDAVRIAPAATAERAREGWALYAKGDVDGAREALAEAARAEAPVWVFYALGQTEFALQNYPAAAEAWNTVRQRLPAHKEVYFDLADAHIQMRSYGEAVRVLREATQRWPSDPEVFNALGVVLARRDALDEAVESFRTAVALAPSEALGHFNLARALEIRYGKSLRYNAAMSRWIGRESDRTEAIVEYRRYLEIGGPQDATARESLSRLEWKH